MTRTSQTILQCPVLVLDDNPDDREFYRRALAKVTDTHYIVYEAENAKQVFDQLALISLECILLDYSMPGQTGLDILKDIREKYPYLAVIMLTGQGSESLAVKAMHKGAQDYIVKSNVDAEMLDHVIQNAIERCHLMQKIDTQRESLTAFTHALTHDLKEPVRMIRSFLQLIEEDQELTLQNEVYFNHVITATQNMDKLIDMVYSYTKLDTSAKHAALEAFSVAEIISAVKSNLAQIIRETGAEIKVAPLPDILGNEIQLVQLFQNLILNAIVHNDKKRCVVTIDGEETEHGLLIRVEDNGPGIKEAYLTRIFEPFARFSSTKKGSGLGLAICKRIVELHGRQLSCHSTLGEGACFSFCLSLAAKNGSRNLSDKITTGYEEKSNSNSSRLANVLLVDDDELDLKLAKIMLQEKAKLEFNLYTVNNGQEALDFLHHNDNPMIDLVLLDLNMPVMNGFEFLKTIRGEKKLAEIPVVICSTSNSERDMQEANKLGSLGYICKPPNLTKLQEALIAYGRFVFENKGLNMRFCCL